MGDLDRRVYGNLYHSTHAYNNEKPAQCQVVNKIVVERGFLLLRCRLFSAVHSVDAMCMCLAVCSD